MEHNIATWHTAKLKKYETELRIEAERNRWSLHTIVIEVGARGWIPSNVASSLARLGLPAVKNLCGKLGLLAVKSSYVIWLNRFNKDFQTWRISVGDQSAGCGAPFAGDGAVSTNPAGSALDGVVSQAKAQVMPSSEQTLVPSLTPRDHIAMLPLQNLLAAGGEDIKHSGLPSGGSRESLSRLLRFTSPPAAPTSWRLDRKDVNAGSVSGAWDQVVVAGREQSSLSDYAGCAYREESVG